MTISTVEATTSTNQNTNFSPALKRAGRILVALEVAVDVHEPADVLASPMPLSRTKRKKSHGTPMIRIGPTKLCRVFASVASHENSV